MDRNNIDKIAKNPEDRLLLAKLWDKINTGIQRKIPSCTCFLSPRELDLARYLFGKEENIISFGGHEDAERRMLIYLPEYLGEDYLHTEDAPLVCLRGHFYSGDAPSHRDFLGALMGIGIARETVGDICVHEDFCDFFTTAEVAPFVLQNLTGAGRTKLRLSQIPLEQMQPPEAHTIQIKDTVASIRLDSIISTGFRIGRNQAAQFIVSGRVAIDGLGCEKPDKLLQEGACISVRGMGKIRLTGVTGTTKKGRIAVIIDRYV